MRPSTPSRAAALFSDPEALASPLCAAAERLFGDGWLLWEPQTIWLELEHLGVKATLLNREQLMAGRGVRLHGRAYYDALVFDRTVRAFNGDEPDHAIDMGRNIGHAAWAVDEMHRIDHDDPGHVFDREITGLMACGMHLEGWVLTPKELDFAQAQLDRLGNKDQRDLKARVADVRAHAAGLAVRNIPYPETPVGVQMARLGSVQAYVEARAQRRERQLAQTRA